MVYRGSVLVSGITVDDFGRSGIFGCPYHFVFTFVQDLFTVPKTRVGGLFFPVVILALISYLNSVAVSRSFIAFNLREISELKGEKKGDLFFLLSNSFTSRPCGETGLFDFAKSVAAREMTQNYVYHKCGLNSWVWI